MLKEALVKAQWHYVSEEEEEEEEEDTHSVLIKSAVLENNELCLFGMWEQSEIQQINLMTDKFERNDMLYEV